MRRSEGRNEYDGTNRGAEQQLPLSARRGEVYWWSRAELVGQNTVIVVAQKELWKVMRLFVHGKKWGARRHGILLSDHSGREDIGFQYLQAPSFVATFQKFKLFGILACVTFVA